VLSPSAASRPTASEILDQALHFRRLEAVNHVVYMGMGEPFLNAEAVLESARRLPDLGVTHRRTTISTVGWMPGLRRFVDEVEQPIRLALSIHAADPGLRSELMPVNDRYPLSDVLAECRRYVELRRRKVFVEYVLLAGVNDSPAQARELAALLDGRAFKVNLIPYNPTGMFEGLRAPRSRRSSPCSTASGPRNRPAHPRPRHRGRLRAARLRQLREHVSGTRRV
jgi:23S rRNA (adenine2503-C2)-methyltransferase